MELFNLVNLAKLFQYNELRVRYVDFSLLTPHQIHQDVTLQA